MSSLRGGEAHLALALAAIGVVVSALSLAAFILAMRGAAQGAAVPAYQSSSYVLPAQPRL